MSMKNEICRQAIERFGSEAQIIKSIEEFSELQKALAKYLNRKYSNNSEENLVDDIIDEIVDCSIMLRQMTLMFADEDIISKFENRKLERLVNYFTTIDTPQQNVHFI